MKHFFLPLFLSAGLAGCAVVPYDAYPTYESGTIVSGPYYSSPYYYPYYAWPPSYATFGFNYGYWGNRSGNGHHHGHKGTTAAPAPALTPVPTPGIAPRGSGHMNPSHGHVIGRGGMRR
ncbi:hypothetical protein [Noviherbaspirillum cavernae]|uniref:hypothetical protein n=1 Tax=Noviherbaspirillum cavernae TaxID=2320862 RepID=UPI0011C35807|nr:hypothetical protein [Noviherbaspirillum cavernae]